MYEGVEYMWGEGSRIEWMSYVDPNIFYPAQQHSLASNCAKAVCSPFDQSTFPSESDRL